MNSRLVVSLAASLGLAILAAPTAQASLLDSGTAVDRSERVTLADSDVSQVEASWQGLPDAADAVTASQAGSARWAQIELNLGGPRRREVEVEEVVRPRRREVVREVEVERPRRRIVREPECRVRIVRRENENTGRVVVRRIRECD